LATVRPWIKYSLLRVLIFVITLALLLLLHVNGYIAAVVAAIAGIAISYIFFRGLRDQVAADLAASRTAPKARVDDEEEDRLDNQ
jgi:hypothetical protein